MVALLRQKPKITSETSLVGICLEISASIDTHSCELNEHVVSSVPTAGNLVVGWIGDISAILISTDIPFSDANVIDQEDTDEDDLIVADAGNTDCFECNGNEADLGSVFNRCCSIAVWFAVGFFGATDDDAKAMSSGADTELKFVTMEVFDDCADMGCFNDWADWNENNTLCAWLSTETA